MPNHDNAVLVELARHLLSDDASLVDEIRLAIDRPHHYVDRFRERLSYRGIREPEDNLPWIGLVDGLAARGRLDEIDVNGTWDELQSGMELLAGRIEDWAWIAEPQWYDKRPHEVFPEIEKRLSPKGLALLVINIFSDCYPLIVLPFERVEDARRFADLAGYGPILPASEAG
jgi:hypothetical protein